MTVSLTGLMLFVQDVQKLANFYCSGFGFVPAEPVTEEWAVLATGAAELALHRVGQAWRSDSPATGQPHGNAKLVLTTTEDLDVLRSRLIEGGTDVTEIVSWPGIPGRRCDGRDPEGNVFQLVQTE